MKKQILAVSSAIVLSMALIAGCSSSKNETAQTTAATESAETQAAVTEAEDTEDSSVKEETVTAATTAPSEEPSRTVTSGDYNILRGKAVNVSDDAGTFNLEESDGSVRAFNESDILDIETDIEEGSEIAIVCIGNVLVEGEEITYVVLLPDQDEWDIVTAKGVTTSNAMSTFSMDTEDGENLIFLKDNCPIESGSLSNDSGDSIEVVYVTSDDTNYPIEIKAGK